MNKHITYQNEKMAKLKESLRTAKTEERKRNISELIKQAEASINALNATKNQPSIKKQNTMKVKYEVIKRIKGSGRDIMLENNLTEAQAKKIVNAFPNSEKHIVLFRIDSKSIKPTKKELKGLKAPATKGLRTLCAKSVGVTGLRKKDGTQKKGYIAKNGGKLVRKTTKKTIKK